MNGRSSGNAPRGPRKSRAERRAATRYMVTCAVLCALSVVFLAFGAVLEVMDLTAACLASFVVLLVLLCYGAKYAWLTYAVTAVLGGLLMPQSMAVWTYIGLVGYYPIVRQKLSRLPRVLRWAVKLLLFGAVLCACLFVFHFVVLGGEGSLADSFLSLFGESDSRAVMAWAVPGLSLFTFVLFDVLLDRLMFIYRIRWYRTVEKWMKR